MCVYLSTSHVAFPDPSRSNHHSECKRFLSFVLGQYRVKIRSLFSVHIYTTFGSSIPQDLPNWNLNVTLLTCYLSFLRLFKYLYSIVIYFHSYDNVFNRQPQLYTSNTRKQISRDHILYNQFIRNE